METKWVFSTKAENYAKYRWDYAPAAVEAIFEIADLSADSCVADIGAGTGILTHHFAGKVGKIMAIEPNPQMRLEAEKRLAHISSCTFLDASAEATGLPDHSVDLVSAAQAVHWFDPQPARAEIRRILKPGGWLAILRNHGTDAELDQAMQAVLTPENGVRPHTGRSNRMPVEFYFAGGAYQKQVFPFAFDQKWEGFIGGLCSASNMPDQEDDCFPAFESAARSVFERFSVNGWLTVHGATELWTGSLSGDRRAEGQSTQGGMQ